MSCVVQYIIIYVVSTHGIVTVKRPIIYLAYFPVQAKNNNNNIKKIKVALKFNRIQKSVPHNHERWSETHSIAQEHCSQPQQALHIHPPTVATGERYSRLYFKVHIVCVISMSAHVHVCRDSEGSNLIIVQQFLSLQLQKMREAKYTIISFSLILFL